MRNRLIAVLIAAACLASSGAVWARDMHGRFDRHDGYQGGGHYPSYYQGRYPDRWIFRRAYRERHLPLACTRIGFGGFYYYYGAGLFFNLIDGLYVGIAAPLGLVVPALPVGFEVARVNGHTYFSLYGTYYCRTDGGYEVVPSPYDTPPSGTTNLIAYTVWLPNANGSKTPVIIRQSGDGRWIGPKGEYYDRFPTIKQLLPLYGIGESAAQPAPPPAPAAESAPAPPSGKTPVPAAGQAAVPSPPATPAAEAVPAKPTAEAVPATPAAEAVPANGGQTQQQQIVWIKNDNGSRSPVVLIPAEDGTWIGPRGEVYDKLPTADQLRPIYGLNAPAGNETPQPQESKGK